MRAQAAISLGRVTEADQILTENSAAVQKMDPWTVAVALTVNGLPAVLLGDHSRAEQMLDESVVILDQLGPNPFGEFREQGRHLPPQEDDRMLW